MHEGNGVGWMESFRERVPEEWRGEEGRNGCFVVCGRVMDGRIEDEDDEGVRNPE